MLGTYFQGDTLDIYYQIKDAQNVPIDLTNWQIRAEINNFGPVKIKKATKNVNGGSDDQISIIDSLGNIKITVEKEQTTDMNPGNYTIEIEITSPLGKRYTIVQDTIKIDKDIIDWENV
jgi:hypothetical protein